VFRFLRSVFSRRSSVPGTMHAVAQFQRFETELQQDFFALAAKSEKPRGLRWVSCEWPGEVLIVAQELSELITAFASVNIGFEAVEGGDMEGVAAVSTIRDGSAVFQFQENCWGSVGRVIFNMDPSGAAEQLVPEAAIVFQRP